MDRTERRRAFSAAAPLALLVAVVAAPAPAGAAGAPQLELPFRCDTQWNGNSAASGAHVSHEIDFNWGSGSDDLGKPVLAAAAGQVAARWGDGYGNYVKIDHGDGYSTLYAHLNQIDVRDGARVAQGARIGTVGNSSGKYDMSPHLHFEYHNYNYSSSYPSYIRPATFGGDPFDYASGAETYTSQNCGADAPPDRSISAVVGESGRPVLFARSGSGELKVKHKLADGWSQWFDHGGSLASGPDASARRDGVYDVVARGTNGKVVHQRRTAAGDWTGFQTRSTFDTPYAPAVVTLDDDTLLVFAVRAADGALMRTKFDQGGWGDWDRIGDRGNFTSGPDAALRGGGAVDVMVRGADGRTQHVVRDQTTHQWGGIQSIEGPVTAEGVAPAVASRGPRLVDVAVRTPEGELRHRIFNGDEGGWKPWQSIDVQARFVQGPDLVAGTDAGGLQLFARDRGGDLVRILWSGADGWGPVVEVG